MILPPTDAVDGAAIAAAWEDFGDAALAEQTAIAQIEDAIALKVAT